MLSNLKAEKKNLKTIFGIIKEGVDSDKYEEHAVMECLDSLSKKNEEMFTHYSQYIESRIYKAEPIGGPCTLAPEYSDEVGALGLTLDDVRSYLNYTEPKFWEYMNANARLVDADDAKLAYDQRALGIIQVSEQSGKELSSMIAYMPVVHDLESAEVGCILYDKAYRVYRSFGQPELVDKFYGDENHLPEDFRKNYLAKAPSRVRVASSMKPARRNQAINN